MLYLSAGDAGDHGPTPALLDVLANGFAIVALVAKHLFGIAVDLVHQRRNGGDIVGLAGRDHDADGQALGIRACIDLGREAAARTAERVTLGPPLSAGGAMMRTHDARINAMSGRPSRCRRAPPASHPRCHCQPSGGIAEKSNSSCRTPPADRATARRSASTKTSRPSHGDGCAADGQRDGSETVRNTPTHHRSTVRESRLPSAKSSLESILDSCVKRFVHATLVPRIRVE